MSSNEELTQALAQLREEFDLVKKECKSLKDENNDLKKKLGIRNFLKPVPPACATPMETNTESNSETTVNPTVKNVKKPPPFFVSGVKSITNFNQLLSTADIKPIEMKSLSNGEIKVSFNNSDDYRKARVALTDASKLPESERKTLGTIKYHTYRLQEDKPFTVFIRGLHHTTDVQQITSELTEAGHTVTNIVNVIIKKRIGDKVTNVKLPLFKVDVKTNDSNRNIYNIRYLCSFSVTVEPPRVTSSLPQCKRCQDIGHSANYCTKTPRCVKCGERHLVKDCKLPKDSPPRCANCKGDHTANYKGCSFYQSKLAPTSRARKMTAVERIRSCQSSASANHANAKSTVTYATATKAHGSISAPVKTVAPIPPVAPIPSVTPPSNDLTKILESLQRMESNQKNIANKITNLENRIITIETSTTPSPPRKISRK